MFTTRLARIAFAFTFACAAWFTWFLVGREANSFGQAFACSEFALLAAASIWLASTCLEPAEPDASRRVEPAPHWQVVVTRALRETSCMITKGELFARLAERDQPLSVAQLDSSLTELERGGVVCSDYDEETGERVWRLLTARHRAIGT
jgi:hypothetical protein